jgi:two-component system probable response regulator PhcQ
MLNQGQQPTCEILYVDDEEKALKYFRMAFASKFTIHTAPSAKEGLELMKQLGDRVGIVISDQRMPEMLGAEFLGRIREEYPYVVRILTTAYSDLESAIAAVNKGHIYQYVVKPWEVKEFGMVLQRAADYHHVLTERNQLLSLKMTALQRILSGDRLLWLKLFQPYCGDQPVFARTLAAFVKALPAPAAVNPGLINLSHFQPVTILGKEYAHAVAALDAIGRVDGLTQTDLDARLGEFIAVAQERYGVTPEVLKGETLEIRLVAGANSFHTKKFATDLFGLIHSSDDISFSLIFFNFLLSAAALNRLVKLSIPAGEETGGKEDYVFALAESAERVTGDPIEEFYERVSVWDVNSR